MHHPFGATVKTFKAGKRTLKLHSLPELARQFPRITRLPVSPRIVLESVLRHCDGYNDKRITAEHVKQLANWQPNAARTQEIPFVVARVVLQDFTGVPLLADLAAMRSTALRLGRDPKTIEPLVPVDLVVDHSIMIDHYASGGALDLKARPGWCLAARNTAPARHATGRQRHATARHQGSGGKKFRAHSPLQSRGHGRAAAAVQGQRHLAIARPHGR